MTKKEVQARVLKNGKPLDLDLFSWDKKTNTFSSDINGLVLDFSGIYNVTFKTGSYCTFKTGSYCTFKTDSDCTFKTGSFCTFKTGSFCTFKTGSFCTFKTGWNCTFVIYNLAYIINRSVNNVVVVRYSDMKKIYDLDTLPKDKFLQVSLKGVVERDVKNVEMIDNEIMVLLSDKKVVDGIEVYKSQFIEDYFSNIDKSVFVAKENDLTAHGSDIKDAIKNVIFKKLYAQGVEENAKRVVESDKVTMDDYRLLTGSCEVGTKRFLDEQGIEYDTVMSIEDTIALVKKAQAYRYEVFIENLKKAGYRK